jgi:threonine dehydratase
VTAEKKAVQHEITSEYLVKILSSRVYEVATETKTAYAANLSAFLKNDVYLKREDTQPVFSFKIRGAYNKIASLSPEQRTKGVVTCSAGNHAQGVALSSAKQGIQATIVMPEATPEIKVNAVKRFGGKTVNVLLHGSNFDEAAAEARRLVVSEHLTLVHPFDDEFVIAGQGTIGMEILKVRIIASCASKIMGLPVTTCVTLLSGAALSCFCGLWG